LQKIFVAPTARDKKERKQTKVHIQRRKTYEKKPGVHLGGGGVIAIS